MRRPNPQGFAHCDLVSLSRQKCHLGLVERAALLHFAVHQRGFQHSQRRERSLNLLPHGVSDVFGHLVDERRHGAG
jgi:hypothetical protein